MIVWLLSYGESLPVQEGIRHMRTGMLAKTLVQRGHTVFWWSSTFSHPRKILLYDEDKELEIESSFKLLLLYAGSYKRNISLDRHRHNRILARKFRRRAPEQQPPDIIISALPTVELAYEAVRFARAKKIPVIVDTRDPWPDVLLEKIPRLLRPCIKALMGSIYRKARYLFGNADYLVAVAHEYLEWSLAHGRRQRGPHDTVFHIGYDDAQPLEGAEDTAALKEVGRFIEGKVVFTFIGSFGHSYDLQSLCQTASRLEAEGHHHVCFIFAGDGEQSASVKAYADRLSNIRLTGWLSQPEIAALMRMSDVGLAPYCMAVERVPNKPFEYLSANLPLLSSLEGEMARIIADNDAGFSYRHDDLEALYRHVITLSDDEALRQRQSANAQRLFAEEFRAQKIYNEYADFIEKMA